MGWSCLSVHPVDLTVRTTGQIWTKRDMDTVSAILHDLKIILLNILRVAITKLRMSKHTSYTIWCCDLVANLGTTKQSRYNASKCTLQGMKENVMCILVHHTLYKLAEVRKAF